MNKFILSMMCTVSVGDVSLAAYAATALMHNKDHSIYGLLASVAKRKEWSSK